MKLKAAYQPSLAMAQSWRLARWVVLRPDLEDCRSAESKTRKISYKYDWDCASGSCTGLAISCAKCFPKGFLYNSRLA